MGMEQRKILDQYRTSGIVSTRSIQRFKRYPILKNFNQKLQRKISKSVTLTSRSLMWVMMVQHKTSDQYLTSGKVSTRSIHGFKRYRLLKTFNILSNADVEADANADAMVTAIALPVLSYRRANKRDGCDIDK